MQKLPIKDVESVLVSEIHQVARVRDKDSGKEHINSSNHYQILSYGHQLDACNDLGSAQARYHALGSREKSLIHLHGSYRIVIEEKWL